MFSNDRRMSQELDNYITGNYGEDQFKSRSRGSKRNRQTPNKTYSEKPVTNCKKAKCNVLKPNKRETK